MHCWTMLNNHSIDFNDARGINKGNFRLSDTLDHWYTGEPVIRNNYPGNINSVMNH